MFSKALFKQSVKANYLMWCIITFAVCFMLACVMLISGGGDIADVKNGVEDTIIKSEIEANIKGRAINYYELDEAALTEFDNYFIEEYAKSGNAETAYATAVGRLKQYADAVISGKGYSADSDEAMEIAGLIFYTLNPKGAYNNFYASVNETPLTYDMSSVTSADRADYRKGYCKNASAIFLAGNMCSEENIDKMVKQLEDFGVTKDKYLSFGYSYSFIKHLANTTSLTYDTRLEYELDGLDKNSPDYDEKVSEVKLSLVGDITGGFLASLPEEVAEALQEVGSADLYNLIVGSIFYKMAGLLLPIIYVIMVSNSLIAGQVDSGSMAYVLSTSTKRDEVTFTQAAFLILSISAMMLMTTLTSVICLAIVSSPDITLTYGQLILMNLGAFMVLLAISGLCFMTSCIFNRSKKAMAIGGGLSMFFLVATMLGLFGSPDLPSVIRLSALNFFNYVTIISLFDTISIIEGTLAFLWKFAILLVMAGVCYAVGFVKFRKKDLPL